MHQLRRHLALTLFALVFFGVSLPSGDATAEPVAVPDMLAPWVDWVMVDAPDLDCPQLHGEDQTRICAWPGTLAVDADNDGAHFSMQVWTATQADIRLPGDKELWPQRVQVDGEPAVVSQAKGLPTIRLEPGSYRLSGEFEWSSLPQFMPVSAQIGHVSLEIDGQAEERPRLDANGRLWLEARQGIDDQSESDRVRTSIYRRIEDGAPLRVITRLELNVSGKAREIEMGRLFIDNSRTIAIKSPLPVDIDNDEILSVYARPGTHEVILESVLTDNVDAIEVPQTGVDTTEEQEVWVWVPDDRLRSVELTGLHTVDPARTTLPEKWHGHTTYLANPGDRLQLETSRRGMRSSPNALQLDREIWLDIEGEGLTIRDRLSGTLQRDWRLDYAGYADLGRVYQPQVGEDMLITEHPETNRSGVELRATELDIVADLRLDEATTTLSAVGWDHDVQTLSTTVNLPPGWSLVSAGGVDSVQGSGVVDSWTLWHFFFVLMVALAIGKLLGWRWAPVAIFALLLSHGYDDAPMWAWIHLVASLALLRALPDGWWRKIVHVYRVITLLVLFVILATFAHAQVQSAIHPQISPHASSGATPHHDATPHRTSRGSMAEQIGSVSDYASASNQAASHSEPVRKGEKWELNQIDPNAVVQTGPGMANWSWNRWHLEWSGPVHRDHQIRLWLVSPTINRLLTFLRVALLIVLALLLLSPRDMAWRKKPDDPDLDGTDSTDGKGHRGTFWRHLLRSSVVLSTCLLVLGTTSLAHANSDESTPEASSNVAAGHHLDGALATPPQGLLEALKERLIAARTCDEHCVVVSRAEFSVQGWQLRMSAEVHAQMDSGWYLPGPADPLQIESVEIDGTETTQFRREPGGLTAVRIPAGRHTVEMVGRLANRDVATLRFDDQARPKTVTFDSDDWTVDGLSSNGVPDSSLQLARREDAQAPTVDSRDRSQDLPPWFHVERFVGLGLPWQVHTTVTREDADRSQLVRIPLLNGESVITDGPRVESNEAHIEIARGEYSVEFISELPIGDRLEFVAPADRPWTETWRVECSRIWRCAFSDLPPVEMVSEDGVYRPTWKPWPHETLTIDVDRPAGAQGQSSTVDDVEYRVTPGKRLLEATLKLTIRASAGGTQTVILPDDAELQRTQINDREQSLRFEDRELSLPIRPGTHTYSIAWQQPWEPAFIERMPEIDIGSEATNIDMTIERRQQRWLLYATGPSWGPAVLFWPHLVMLLIIALLLNALRGVPLKPYEWILLVIGMSQLPYVALIPIVAWFAVLSLRAQSPADAWWKFNFVQLFIVGLTVAATITLYAAIHTNLLFDVDMQVRGANSTQDMLHWYIDRSDGQLGAPGIVSVPILIWRVLMLAWAFWLVSRLLAWLPWGWSAFSKGGLWKRSDKKKKKKKQDATKQPVPSQTSPVQTDGEADTPSSDSPAKEVAQPEDEQGDNKTPAQSEEPPSETDGDLEK